VRVAFDSKTLNDAKSVAKNYQNMINDLASEATTVHIRFPFAVVAFLVAIPLGCIPPGQQPALLGTLERLGTRQKPTDAPHLAEAIALVVWNPATGQVDQTVPPKNSLTRVEGLATKIETAYVARYKGMPPHA
jgi:hypothetical protein